MMAKRLEALEAGGVIEFFANKCPKCPHCGADYDIKSHDAWWLYDEYDRHNVECSTCELEFQVVSRASWSFSTDEQEDPS